MRSKTPLLLAAAALLPWLGPVGSPDSPAVADPSQPQATGDRPRRDAPLPAHPVDPRVAELTGAWELTSIQDPILADPQVRHSGMMLITDGYLSIELHLGLMATAAEQLLEAYFQSGVHRIEVDTHGQLALVGVLGAEVDLDGFLTFEEPGRRRVYRFDVSPNELTLHRTDRRARLVFRRVEHRTAQRDIYGRVIETKPDEEEER